MADDKKHNQKIRIIGNPIFFTIIALMVTFFVWNFIDIKSGYKYPVFGLRTSVIVSPSMSKISPDNDYITSDMKQIQKFDVVTTVKYKSYDDIKIYDVATYYTGSKDLVCHRVVNKYISEGKQYVVFRGDANNVDDAPVSYDLIRGKVISVMPKVGHVVAFIQSPYLLIAIFGTIFFVALGIFIIDRDKQKKLALSEQKEEANQEHNEAVLPEQANDDNQLPKKD